MESQSLKTCKTCEQVKSHNDFYTDKNKRDKLKSTCKPCAKIINAEWRRNNADHVKAKKREIVAKNADYYKKANEEWRRKNAERLSEYNINQKLINNYGITMADYEVILASQNNCCAICSKTPQESGRRLYVDHNHKTGVVRGLLCINCNSAIGKLGDSVALLKNAIQYLEDRGSYGN